MSNSPPTFQRFVNHMLEPFYKKYRRQYLKNYMDDCGLGTKLVDKALHVEMLHYLFDLLAAAVLRSKTLMVRRALIGMIMTLMRDKG